MRNLRRTVHNVFVWSYARGTFQYDILCALILAFVFLVPSSCFLVKKSQPLSPVIRSAATSAMNAAASQVR